MTLRLSPSAPCPTPPFRGRRATAPGFVVSALMLCGLLTACEGLAAVGEDISETLRLGDLVNNLGNPEPNVWTGGQPDETQLDGVTERGVQHLLTLRPAAENGTGWEEDHLAERDVNFVRIPVQSGEDLNRENAQRLAEFLQESGDDHALVYCGSSDRVGALFALKAFYVDGQPAADALEIGRQAGMKRTEPAVRREMGLEPAAADTP